MNREAYLTHAQKQIAEWFQALGYGYPAQTKVSVGFPSRGGLSLKNKFLGQCWDGATTTDGNPQIFVSPLIAESVKALDILIHEMVHAAVGCQHGHKGPFKRLAKAIGLEGNMTATIAGSALTERLNELVEQLGPYPHHAIDPKAKAKKEGTRMLKIQCPACGWTARTTQKGLDAGLPTCHCGEQIESVQTI